MDTYAPDDRPMQDPQCPSARPILIFGRQLLLNFRRHLLKFDPENRAFALLGLQEASIRIFCLPFLLI